MTMFRVGQKVVCVDDAIHDEWKAPGFVYVGGLDGLKKGEIYTVRAVEFDSIEVAESLVLEEIVRPTLYTLDRDGFRASRFRPVVERKTDISIFTDILDRANKGQLEKV